MPNTSRPDNPVPSSPPILIPGAGNIAMFLLLISLSMLFLASIAAVLIVRTQYTSAENAHNVWPPAGFPPLPASLWISNLVILAASVTIQLANFAVKKDDEKNLLRYLTATFLLALLFLAMQTVNWLDFYAAIKKSHVDTEGSLYLFGFYILTALHAAHVIGGLIPLALVIRKAKSHIYSRNFHPGIRYTTLYFHFLDAVWLALFCVLYF